MHNKPSVFFILSAISLTRLFLSAPHCNIFTKLQHLWPWAVGWWVAPPTWQSWPWGLGEVKIWPTGRVQFSTQTADYSWIFHDITAVQPIHGRGFIAMPRKKNILVVSYMLQWVSHASTLKNVYLFQEVSTNLHFHWIKYFPILKWQLRLTSKCCVMQIVKFSHDFPARHFFFNSFHYNFTLYSGTSG